MQLFALPGARDDSLTEPFDVVDGDDNHLSNGILIDPLFLSPATPLEQFIGTASGAASQRLAYWLNEAYAGGANAGKFVFLRLSPNALEIPEGFSFAITTGDDIEENAPGIDFAFDPEASAPAAPAIEYFNTLSTVIHEGASATLQWGVSGASSVSIDQGLGGVASSGSVVVSPSATTTYTLSASVGGAPVTAAVQVTVVPAGTLRHARLTVLSARGGDSLPAAAAAIRFYANGTELPGPVLNWSEPGPAPFTPVAVDFGSHLSPTSYRVTTGAGSHHNDPVAWRIEGSLDGRAWFVIDEREDAGADVPLARNTASDDFFLIPGVPKVSLSASSSVVKPGGIVVLNWNASDAGEVFIDNGIGVQPAVGSVVVSPTTSATYTVSATGAGITVSKSVSILVIDGALLGTTYEGIESATYLAPISNLIAATPSGTFLQTGPILYNGNFYTGQPSDLPGLNSSDSFSVLWLGWFDATVAGFGDYTFGTNSDDGSVIYLDLNDDGDFNDAGELVVDNNGNHGTQVRTGTAGLNREFTRIAIAYYEAGGGDVMEARFKKGTALGWASLDVINANSACFQTERPDSSLPSISFSSSVPLVIRGNPLTLTWNVGNANVVTITGLGTVAASGSATVSPQSSTTYTLTASNASGQRSANLAIDVALGALDGKTYDTLTGSALLDPVANLINSPSTATFLQTSPLAYDDNSMLGVLPGLTDDEDFAVLWSGWFDVSVDGPGDYTFGTGSDDGSVIYLDLNDDGDFADAGELVVDNNGGHGFQTRTGTVALGATCRIVIAYFEGVGEEIMHARFKKGANVPWGDLEPVGGGFAHFQTVRPQDASNPEITTDVATLEGFSTCYGLPSVPRQFLLSGSGLLVAVSLTVTPPFEISESADGVYGQSLSIGGTGTLAATAIHVRLGAAAAADNYDSGGAVHLASNGAVSKSVSIAASVVLQAQLSVTAQPASKSYGDTDPPITYTTSGLVGSDGISGTLARAAGDNAGVYAINQGTLDAGGNYEITFSGADFTILPKALGDADITLTRDGNAYTASAAGVASFSYSYSGREGTSYGPSADAPSADGDYTVTATVDDPNFTGSKSEDFSIGSVQEHPAFKVTSIRMSGTVCTMMWESQPGASYTVEASDNPADAQSWTTLRAAVASQGSTTTVTIDIAVTSQAGAAKLFMRVRTQDSVD